MKSIIAGLLLTLAIAVNTHGQDKTEFSKIWDSGFNTYQSAEDSLSDGNKDAALNNFKKALDQFNQIQTTDLTSWQKKIIAYRIGLCKSNIEAIVRSISTGTPVAEIVPVEPTIQANTVKNAAELLALKKQRQSIEDTLKIYIDKYNQEVTSSETIKLDLQDSTKEVHKLKAFNKILTQKLSSADKQLQEQIIKSSKKLESKLANYEQKIANLKLIQAAQKNEIAKIQAYVESKETEFDKLVVNYDLLKIEADSLQNDTKSKANTIESLRAKVQTIESNLGATKETTSKTNEYVSSQKLYITKLTNENVNLNEELQSTIKLLKSNENKIESGSKENFQLKMFLQEKINEKNELTASVAELQNTIATTEDTLLTVKSDLRSRTIKDQKVSAIIDSKNKIIKQSKVQLSVKDASITELQTQYKSLQSDFAGFKNQAAKNAAAAEMQNQYITELQNQLIKVQKDLEDNKLIVAAKEEALSQGIQGTSKLKEAIQIELTEKETIQETVAKLLDEKATQEDDIKKLNLEIAKMEAAKLSFEDQIAKQKDENASQDGESNKLKIALAKVKMDLSTKDVDIAILNEQVIGLQNKLHLKPAPLVRATAQAKKAIAFTSGSVQESTKTGTLYRIRTKSTYITHALVDANRKPLCYVHFSSTATQYEGKKISIAGLLRTVKGWKAPVLDASKVTLL